MNVAFNVTDLTTGKVPDVRKIAMEEWAKLLIPSEIDCFAIDQDGCLLLLDTCGNFAACPTLRFKVVLEVSE